ncbi:MAG: hypothetical protein ABIP55_05400 [Tepidisphaeraceae bacterium]
MMTQTDAIVVPSAAPTDELIAEPDAGYRWKHLIMAILLIAGGVWFAYDGWVKWPAENATATRLEKEKDAAQRAAVKDEALIEKLARDLQKYEKHNDAGILIQKLLAIVCPGLGLFWGVWTLWDTRGRYRMAADTLEVPGHPPVKVSDIRRIDKRKWDRKGIAYLHYERGIPPAPGVFRLDDFAYERKATDAMLERIEKNVLPSVTTSNAVRSGT